MNSSDKRGPPAPARPRKWLVILLMMAALLAASSWLVLPGRLEGFLQLVLAETRHLGGWAPVIFILLYIACCVALLPTAILTLSAGALFGAVQGSVYVSIGATLGATAAFLLGRYSVRAW